MSMQERKRLVVLHEVQLGKLALVEAADVLLRSVLDEGEGAPRERALDLLAADACVTWAFEAAWDDPGSLGAHAAAAEQYQHYTSVVREELGIEPPPLDQL